MITQNNLVDILEIQGLKARYIRLADSKSWKELRKVFADDFHCQVKGAPRMSPNDPDIYEVHGADEFIANASKMVAGIQAMHQLSLPEIAITSGTTATGIWALHDYLVAPHCILRGWGHYHDDYIKIDGDWKIQNSVVTRIRVEETWL
jgi:hypothetical protein